MIPALFSHVLNFIATIINSIGSIWTLPVNVFATIDVVVGYCLMFDGLVPMRTILFAFSTILSFEILLFVIKTILMVINWSRGTGQISID